MGRCAKSSANDIFGFFCVKLYSLEWQLDLQAISCSMVILFQIRVLKKEEDTKKKQILLTEIGAKYFNPESGLVLDNTELWKRCADSCSSSSDESAKLAEAEKLLTLAHDSVLPELDELHLLFLQQRRDQTCVDKILCIL